MWKYFGMVEGKYDLLFLAYEGKKAMRLNLDLKKGKTLELHPLPVTQREFLFVLIHITSLLGDRK